MALTYDPKRMIPKLAVAALALTGCAGTDGFAGTSGAGGINGPVARSLEAFCLKLVECFPAYYADNQACIDYISVDNALDANISSECEVAAVSYFQCGTPLTCQELDMPGANSCAGEAAAASQACS